MNKKGQFEPFYFFMIGIIIFLLSFGLSSSLIKNSDKVRVDMNCSSSVLPTTEKISCTVVDTVAPFFLGIVITFGSMVFLAKVVGG